MDRPLGLRLRWVDRTFLAAVEVVVAAAALGGQTLPAGITAQAPRLGRQSHRGKDKATWHHPQEGQLHRLILGEVLAVVEAIAGVATRAVAILTKVVATAGARHRKDHRWVAKHKVAALGAPTRPAANPKHKVAVPGVPTRPAGEETKVVDSGSTE